MTLDNLFHSKYFAAMTAVLVTSAEAQNKFYVDWSTGTCVNDSNNLPWDEIYGSLGDCCEKNFWWKEDCVEPPSLPVAPTPITEFQSLPVDPAPTPRPTEQTPAPTPRPTERNRADIKIKPRDDTFIDESHPGRNYNNRKMLHCRAKKGTRESLMKFNLSVLQNKCITSATLSLYSLQGARRGGAIVKLVPNAKRNSFARRVAPWKEHRATWRSIKRKLVPDTKLKSLGAVGQDSWVDIDVTAGIKNEFYVTLAIVSEGDTVKYASKERSGYSPMLSIMLC